MTEPLVAKELYRFFHTGDEEIFALRGVSLTVTPGEMLAVTGPSGSGKSTLLACLAGLDEPSGGTVWVGGRRISRIGQAQATRLRARHIGLMFQSENLLGNLSVAENIDFVQRLAKMRNAARLHELLARLGLGDVAKKLPSQISGGELARSGLAVALANSPDVVLADEPTGELDGEAEERVISLLQEHAASGGSIVVVTHSSEVAAAATRTIVMSDGEEVTQ